MPRPRDIPPLLREVAAHLGPDGPRSREGLLLVRVETWETAWSPPWGRPGWYVVHIDTRRWRAVHYCEITPRGDGNPGNSTAFTPAPPQIVWQVLTDWLRQRGSRPRQEDLFAAPVV